MYSDDSTKLSEYVEVKIRKGLIKYLEEVHDIKATNAEIGETENERYRTGYCDTCAYTEVSYSFNIRYQTAERYGYQYVTIEGDPLNFFPTLYTYMEK